MLTREYKSYSAAQLRGKLAEHRVTGTRFAEMVGVPQTTMSGYLRGRVDPPRVVRIRIAEVIEELDEANPVDDSATEQKPIVVPSCRSL